MSDKPDGMRIAVSIVHGSVVIDFAKDISWLGLGPTEAAALGQVLIERSNAITGKEHRKPSAGHLWQKHSLAIHAKCHPMAAVTIWVDQRVPLLRILCSECQAFVGKLGLCEDQPSEVSDKELH